MRQPVSQIEVPFHLPAGSRLLPQNASAALPLTKGAVFLDRDGVVVEEVHYLKRKEQLRILPGVPEALRMLQAHFYTMVVTNQSGIARGFLTEDDLLLIHQELDQRLGLEGVTLDGLYYCPHLPEAPAPAYRTACECRKPNPGMLLQASADWGIDLSRSFLVGDRPRDIEAASGAGVLAIMVGAEAAGTSGFGMYARDLLEAASLILAAASSTKWPDGAENVRLRRAGPESVSPGR